MTAKKKYDIRFQYYKHDKQRLELAAKAEQRSMANLVKKLVTEYLDSFEKQLEDRR